MTEEILTFEGNAPGVIAEKEIGTGGFGYDPIFIPYDGEELCTNTFAEDPHLKKRLSHRSRAIKRLAEYLTMNDP